MGWQVNIVPITQYAAQCCECFWFGRLRHSYSKAESDGEKHRKEHQTIYEKEQASGRVRKSI